MDNGDEIDDDFGGQESARRESARQESAPQTDGSRPTRLPLEWALKAARRLSMLEVPGVYEVQLLVRPDKTRELVILNAERPHKLEHLGDR